jgi:hypothetical protein
MRKPIILSFIITALLASCVIYTGPPEKYIARAMHKKPYDLIIVPGFPYDSAQGTWHDIVKRRVYWSHYLYKNGYALNVMYSGGAVYTPYVEGEFMALYGRAVGIDSAHIYSEGRAEHSTENVYYSYHLAKQYGFKRIALATDHGQSKLLRAYCSIKNIKMDFIPIIYDTLFVLPMPDVFIDAEKTKIMPFVSIMERDSKWKRMMGTLGFNVKKVKR